MVCNCRGIVHSGQERQIQLFKEPILPMTSLADRLIQGHRAIAIRELNRSGHQSAFDFFYHRFGHNLDLLDLRFSQS